MSVTAADVLAEARARYGEDGLDAQALGETYESMQAMAARVEAGVFYTPRPVALEQAIRQVGPDEAHHILRIVACDPACGCGVFLTEAARLLAANYAGRLFGAQPTQSQVFAVMPTVVLWCVYGLDIDPVAAELARLALSWETGGTLPPEALVRHVVCGDALAGDSPPAMEDILSQARRPDSGRITFELPGRARRGGGKP